jgi:CheY-like chemotaxis protein
MAEGILLASSSSGKADNFIKSSRPDVKRAQGWESKFNILVIEDNLINQKVARLQLSDLGFKFKIVSNGEEALAEYSTKKYDAILLDLGMPGLSGFDVAKIIRAEEKKKRIKKRVKIIAYTAFGDEKLKDAMDAGCDDMLIKPVNIDVMHATLKKILKIPIGKGGKKPPIFFN